MKSIKFPGCDFEIGKGQPEYDVLHAMRVPSNEGEVIICFELTQAEIEDLIRTRKLYYMRWTFGEPFQPMRLTTDLSDNIELPK